MKTKFGQKFATCQTVLAAHRKESRTFIQKGTMSLKKKKNAEKEKTQYFSVVAVSLDLLTFCCLHATNKKSDYGLSVL